MKKIFAILIFLFITAFAFCKTTVHIPDPYVSGRWLTFYNVKSVMYYSNYIELITNDGRVITSSKFIVEKD